MTQSDEIGKMKNGTEESRRRAFDILYHTYSKQLLRTAYLITGNLADSEDIVQESFIKCYCHIGELQKEGQFKVWLFQIMKRTAWRYCKKNRKEKPLEDVMQERSDDEYAISAQDEYLQLELQQNIRKQINKLYANHRLVIILYYYNQMSVKEIAKIAGCLEGTVKSRLYTARNKLSLGLGDLKQPKPTYQEINQIREERMSCRI